MVTYVAPGTASAATTVSTPGYPAGIAAGDLLRMVIASDSASIVTPSGWALKGSITTSGGLSMAEFEKTATGSETGTQSVSITGGTKGVGTMQAYRPTAGTTVATTSVYGSDTDSTSTAISASGASWTLQTGDVVAATVAVLAPSGAFTGSATGISLTNSGATLSATARYGARTGSNTIYYGHIDGSTTAGGTGAPTYAATAVGANAAGVVVFTRFAETATTTTVAAAFASTWAVRQAVAASSASTWAVRSSAAATTDVQWGVRAAVGASAAVSWAVRAAVATTVPLSWSVAGQVTKPVVVTWATRAAVGNTWQVGWVDRAIVGTAVDVAWVVQQIGSVSVGWSFTWNVAAAVALTWPTTWLTLAQVDSPWIVEWATFEQVEMSWPLAWRVRIKPQGWLWRVREDGTLESLILYRS